MLVVYSCSRCDVNIFGTFSICISQGRIGYLFEHVMVFGSKHLEALPVDNGWAALIVLLLGDPHLLEGGQGRQDGSANPDRVLPLRGSNDLDLDGGGSKGGDLLLHTVSNTRIHGGTTRHDSVGVQVLPDVNITLHDGVVGGLMDTAGLHAKEGRLEEGLRGTEPLVADGDDLAIGQLIGLLKGGGGSSSGHLLLKVKGDIAELLLDITDNLTLSSGGERVAPLGEDLHQVVGELTSSKVKTDDGVWESITLIDGDTVGDTVTGVHDNTSGTARGIEGKDSLDGNVHGGHVEGLEHDLGHLLTVSLGVEGSLSQEDRLLLWGNTEFIVEGVVPDLLHVIPVGDDSVLNGVLEGEDTSLGLSLISNIGILLSHTDHDTLVSWSSNNGWEDGSWSIVSGESSLAHAGAIVNNQSSNSRWARARMREDSPRSSSRCTRTASSCWTSTACAAPSTTSVSSRASPSSTACWARSLDPAPTTTWSRCSRRRWPARATTPTTSSSRPSRLTTTRARSTPRCSSTPSRPGETR